MRELEQILDLQQRNLPKNISQEEREKEGFVTVEHDLDLLRAMNAMREIWREEKIRREYGTHNLLPLYPDEVDMVCNSG